MKVEPLTYLQIKTYARGVTQNQMIQNPEKSAEAFVKAEDFLTNLGKHVDFYV